MVKIKTLSVTLAFLIAIGGCFATVPVNSVPDYITVKGRDPHCPVGWVDSKCQLTSVGTLCTFLVGFRWYHAIDEDEFICMEGLLLKIPH